MNLLLLRSILTPITIPLSLVYGYIIYLRNLFYDLGWFAAKDFKLPVISVGNITTGGSGKTPVAKFIAELLRDAGEYPAILSRGYGRSERAEGVVVVRDRSRVLADFDVAGDEPRMLSEQLSDVCVLVGEDRYVAGRLAETQFGATVHVLDDGFQHYALEVNFVDRRRQRSFQTRGPGPAGPG